MQLRKLESKIFLNGKMLPLMAPIYSERTYKVCVCFMWFLVTRFREIGAEWRVCWCFCLLCVLLNSNYRCTVQAGLLKMVLPAGK